MKLLIAADSFKDALSAMGVCEAIAHGLRLAIPDATLQLLPLADGGEGTAEILTYHSKGAWLTSTVNDPLFRPVEAAYGLSGDGKTAFLDMAQASGLQLLKPEERNPLKTTTFGVGQLITKAVEAGARKVILGVGGSATNDGGLGMAAALGYRFLDKKGRELSPVGDALLHVARMDASKLKIDLSKVDFRILCDVDNPLYGLQGAAYIYARQKGANDNSIEHLDQGLRHFAKVLNADNLALKPGAGAAGGMGFAGLFFLKGQLQAGIDTVMDIVHFDQAMSDVDFLFTGEGRIDEQTLHGKLISGVCQRAKKQAVPVIALCGALNANPAQIQAIGLQSAFSIQNRPIDLATALINTAENLERTAFSIGKLLRKEF